MLKLGLSLVTQQASIALSLDGRSIAERKLRIKTLDNIIDVVDQLLVEAHVTLQDVDELVVVNGPGGYAGVRMSVTIAKMWGLTLEMPIKAINSVELLAYQVRYFEGLIVVAMRSRKDEVNFGLFGGVGLALNPIIPFEPINLQKLSEKLSHIDGDFLIVGDLLEEEVPDLNKFVFQEPDAMSAINLSESKETIDFEHLNPIYAYPVNINTDKKKPKSRSNRSKKTSS
jgi:tRNA threonylcarbamoyladenosine biosynthesis protein TsaB